MYFLLNGIVELGVSALKADGEEVLSPDSTGASKPVLPLFRGFGSPTAASPGNAAPHLFAPALAVTSALLGLQ